MASKLRRAGQLSRQEWVLLLKMMPLLWTAAWLVRRRPLARLLAWASSDGRSAAAARPVRQAWEQFSAQRISDLVGAAARSVLPSGSCLPQSVVTCRLLNQAGYSATVVIGTKPEVVGDRSPRPFTAHAWVEVAPQAQDSRRQAFDQRNHDPLVKLGKIA